MKWGQSWGLYWGWAEIRTLSHTVQVRLMRDEYIPCKSCTYFKECVVPRGRRMPNIKRARNRVVYTCEEYTPRIQA